MKKFACTIALIVPFLFFAVLPVSAAPKAAEKAKEKDECRAELLIDHASGETIFEKNAHEPQRPASMVKLMLAYVVFKQVAEGNHKWDELVTASAKSSKTGGSQVFLKQGEQFTLSQLLEAVLVQSANDAAAAIAEHIGGTTDGFVEIMNQEAQTLGMKESVFKFPHGLPPSADQEPDLVSANDFGILARELIRRYPQALEYTSKDSAPFRDGTFTMSNHNHLLRSFPGCDGLKTGYYGEAGFSVAATAKKNDMRMIAVVMGCPSRKGRDEEAAKLLSKGFVQYKSVKLLDQGAPVGDEVFVSGGEKSKVGLVTLSEARVTVKTGEESKVTQQKQLCSGLSAPVAKNTPCGSIKFFLGERELSSVPLIIPEDIAEGGLIQKAMSYFGY